MQVRVLLSGSRTMESHGYLHRRTVLMDGTSLGRGFSWTTTRTVDHSLGFLCLLAVSISFARFQPLYTQSPSQRILTRTERTTVLMRPDTPLCIGVSMAINRL